MARRYLRDGRRVYGQKDRGRSRCRTRISRALSAASRGLITWGMLSCGELSDGSAGLVMPSALSRSSRPHHCRFEALHHCFIDATMGV